MTTEDYDRLGLYYSRGQAMIEDVISIIHGRISLEEWEREKFFL